MRTKWRFCAGVAAVVGLLASGFTAQAQQKSEIAVSRQPGILYMPTHIIEKQKLIEKHAALLGLPNVTTKWVTLSGGGAQTDALLAGGVDILCTGTGNLLLLWDRTKGGVKGIVATSAQPMSLISRDERIKTIKDFGPGDKIAVPTVKVSTQAIVLQIAAAKLFGDDQWSKFDSNTVQLGHPDAVGAMSNPAHEIHNHFTIPPYTFIELKNVPGAHVVLTSTEVMGGPLSQAQFFTTTKFADANPKIIEAVRAASKEAQDLIRSRYQDRGRYLQGSHRRQDQCRGPAGLAQGARHDGVEFAAAGHHEIRRPSLQGRHAEDQAEGVDGLLSAEFGRSQRQLRRSRHCRA